MPSRTPPKIPSLRATQKAMTRNRILDAAKILFFSNGYSATTVDQIAIHAGMQRSTLYTYFKDKDEVLDGMAADYAPKIADVLARLPTGRLRRAQIDRWIGQMARFVEKESMPTGLFITFGSLGEPTEGVLELYRSMLEQLGRAQPAFAAACGEDVSAMPAHARAQQVIRDLFWVCHYRAQHGNTAFAREMLQATAELFDRFVNASPVPLETGSKDIPAQPIDPIGPRDTARGSFPR